MERVVVVKEESARSDPGGPDPMLALGLTWARLGVCHPTFILPQRR